MGSSLCKVLKLRCFYFVVGAFYLPRLQQTEMYWDGKWTPGARSQHGHLLAGPREGADNSCHGFMKVAVPGATALVRLVVAHL